MSLISSAWQKKLRLESSVFGLITLVETDVMDVYIKNQAIWSLRLYLHY